MELADATWFSGEKGMRLLDDGCTSGKVVMRGDRLEFELAEKDKQKGLFMDAGGLLPNHVYHFALKGECSKTGMVFVVWKKKPHIKVYSFRCVSREPAEINFTLDGISAQGAFIGLDTYAGKEGKLRVRELSMRDIGELPRGPAPGRLKELLLKALGRMGLLLFKARNRFRGWRYKYLNLWGAFGNRVLVWEDAALHGSRGLFIGDDVQIGRGAILCSLGPGTIVMGKGSVIGHWGLVVSESFVSIGKDTLIGGGSVILDSNHVFSDTECTIKSQGNVPSPVIIEDDCWLGANVCVMSGVTIGRGSVIGAGAVVTKDIPPYSVAVGVPARVIKKRKGR